jgi:hypothetical protein
VWLIFGSTTWEIIRSIPDSSIPDLKHRIVYTKVTKQFYITCINYFKMKTYLLYVYSVLNGPNPFIWIYRKGRQWKIRSML